MIKECDVSLTWVVIITTFTTIITFTTYLFVIIAVLNAAESDRVV